MASLTFFVPSTRLDSKGRLLPLPGRNELENTARTNRQKAGKEKKDETERVKEICEAAMAEHGWEMPPDGVRVEVTLLWSEMYGPDVKNRCRDQDNITAYQKPLLDGIVKAGAIAGDGPAYIKGFSKNYLRYDRQNPGVLVTLETVAEIGEQA